MHSRFRGMGGSALGLSMGLALAARARPQRQSEREPAANTVAGNTRLNAS